MPMRMKWIRWYVLQLCGTDIKDDENDDTESSSDGMDDDEDGLTDMEHEWVSRNATDVLTLITGRRGGGRQ